VQPELELGDHAEVAAAAAQRPEQVRVLLRAGPQHLAGGGDDLGGQQVVTRQPELRGEPAEPAAQGQPADPGVADRAAGSGQPVRLGGRVELRQRGPAAGPGGPRARVHRHLVDGAEVDGQAAVADRRAGEAVRAAAHRDLQAGVLREPDRGGHVAGVGAAGDHGRVSVDGAVPHRTGLVIVPVRGGDQPAGEPGPQPVQVVDGCRDVDGGAVARSRACAARWGLRMSSLAGRGCEHGGLLPVYRPGSSGR
jgi:hypothetical protein